MIHILNSSMMPRKGTYRLMEVTPQEWAEYVSLGMWESYIGYKETADYVSELLGTPVPTSRKQVNIKDGDVLAIIRLRYRIENPDHKGKINPQKEDFEFFLAFYSE